jgi:TPR repeat protein
LQGQQLQSQPSQSPQAQPQQSQALQAPQLPPAPQAPAQQAQAPQKIEHLSPEETKRLMDLGTKFLAQGDLATARHVLERVAQAGDARANLLLGATYDPEGLKKLGMIGVPPDLKKAQSWYTRAAELGSREASQRLTVLGQAGR